MIDITQIKKVLFYDPDSGSFINLVTRSSRAKRGSFAGSLDSSNGYIKIRVNGHVIYAHRLAWLFMTGSFPDFEVDHINGSRSDNRWANLRQATRAQNGSNLKLKTNNTSGYSGVSFEKIGNKWVAYINISGRKVSLGRYDIKEDAISARKTAEINFFGEFVRA